MKIQINRGTRWQKEGETVTITGIGGEAAVDASAAPRAACVKRETAPSCAGARGRGEGAGDECAAPRPELILRCRESGSTLRFFIPICLQTGRRARLIGAPRLMERPLDVYEKLCEARGLLEIISCVAIFPASSSAVCFLRCRCVKEKAVCPSCRRLKVGHISI